MKRTWSIKLKFEKRDCWIGVFWDRDYDVSDVWETETLSIYICLLPCLPIILRRRDQFS